MTTRRRPLTALSVSDLAASIDFYVRQIGCTLAARADDAHVATIEQQGYLLLLAAPEAGDVSAMLEPVHERLKPPASVYLNGGSSAHIHELRDRLMARGLDSLTLTERWWGDHTLTAVDPDGYRVCFWTTTERTPDETLALYEDGAAALEHAVAGLADTALDRQPGPGEWTIRQIVHHLADAESSSMTRVKMALAEPGREYAASTYLQDAWAVGLDYAGRDIGPAVALVRAIRAHLSQLTRHLPGAWERSTVNREGQALTAGATITMLMSHAYEHIADIERIASGG